jgi:Cu/Ag efflux protein CusF
MAGQNCFEAMMSSDAMPGSKGGTPDNKLAHSDFGILRRTAAGGGRAHIAVRGGLFLCTVALLCAGLLVSCGTAPTNNTNTNAKRYQFTGRVISIDKASKTVDVDGDEIPGFMTAMEMPFSVKDPKLLEQINPGDKIKADLVVSTDGAYLENITVTTKGNGTATPPPK